MNQMHTVFVYGTLQRGCSNHGLLVGSQFLGAAVTEDDFVMRTLVDAQGRRGIPFVGRDIPLGPVHGELFAVDDRTLVQLDQLEGCVPDDPDASWYRREKVAVRIGDSGEVHQAFIYLHERPASPLVASGRWRDAFHITDPCFYFAYGSNMNPQRMLERGVPFDQCMRADLSDHRLVFNKAGNGGMEAYANAVPGKGERLPGLLYRIPLRALEGQLDGFEGVSLGHYQRVEMQVLISGGPLASVQRVNAWVYLACSAHIRSGLPVSERYMRHIRRGHALMGLPS